MVDKICWTAIKEELISTLNKQGINFFDDETKTYLSLYFLINTINNLEIYAQQNQWHTQIYWLINTWNDALSDILKTKIASRKLVILDFFDAIQHQEYAGIKILNTAPENLSENADLDICIHKESKNFIVNYLMQHCLVGNIKIKQMSGQSNLFLTLDNFTFLSIDLVYEFKRKATIFMNAKNVIANAYVDENGIRKMELLDMARYIGLFYGLNKAPI